VNSREKNNDKGNTEVKRGFHEGKKVIATNSPRLQVTPMSNRFFNGVNIGHGIKRFAK
jgi:hypothetical protein